MIADIQLKFFLKQTEILSSKYQHLLVETDEKLNVIIETSQNLQIKLEPLNRNIDQFQNALKNMETCRTALLKTQSFNRTGLEVEKTVNKSPSGNLDHYLSAMDKIRNAIDFFKENDPNNVELAQLNALYSTGKSSIEKEFESILNQAFPIIRPENIFNLCYYKEILNDNESISSSYTVAAEIFDSVAESHIKDLKIISKWLLEDKTINCVVRYCTCRREALRATMERFKEWCKSLNNIEQATFSLRNKVSNSKSNKRKQITKRNIQVLKETSHRRQGSDVKEDFEERESNLFTIRLVALVKLVQNEKLWLEKLNLTPEFKDKCGAMDAIIKGSINDFLTDGNELVKTMNRAQVKHQYQYVVNLIIVLEKFMEIKSDLQDILYITMENTRQSIYLLLNKLTQQIMQCLEVYVEYIKTEKVTAVDGTCVPTDATVHELTTNALRFLETLIYHAKIVELNLSNVNIADKIVNNSSKAVVKSHSNLSKNSGNFTENSSKNSLGEYINKVIDGLITNIINMSMIYNDDIPRIIFQINNIHYIYKTTLGQEFCSLTQLSSDTISKSLVNCINQKKLVYLSTIKTIPGFVTTDRQIFENIPLAKGFIKASNIPESKFYSSLINNPNKIDNSLKAQIKDVWTRFNQSFIILSKSHSLYALPDKDLKKQIVNDLKSTFIPKYCDFRDAFLHVSFTTKRDKYIQYTKDDIENFIDKYFSQ